MLTMVVCMCFMLVLICAVFDVGAVFMYVVLLNVLEYGSWYVFVCCEYHFL